MVFLQRVFGALIAAATIVSVVNADFKPDLNGWYPCAANTFRNPSSAQSDSTRSSSSGDIPVAECATFLAPLCHDGICEDTMNRTVEIFVKRIPAVVNPTKATNVWFMQGGPGAGSTAMESALTSMHKALNNVNVYTMDHRGTGRSTKLDCLGAQAQTSGSPNGDSVSGKEVASCAQELQRRYGDDLASFSVLSAATDMHNFISNQEDGTETIVYGVSYGTTLVERLMHLNTTYIKGYVLDGVSTTAGSKEAKFYFSNWDVQQNEVGDRFMATCDANSPSCGKYFKGSTAGATIRALLDKLDEPSSMCAVALAKAFGEDVQSEDASTLLRMVFGNMLQVDIVRSFIPLITYRLNRCGLDDIKAVAHFINTVLPLLSQKTEDSMFNSDLIYKIIVFSEMWEPPTPTMETMTAWFKNTTISGGIYGMLPDYCAFTKDKAAACASFRDLQTYDANPIMYKRNPKYWGVPPTLSEEKSVLLLSSKLDPQTPQKFAQYAIESIQAKNKELVTFEHATHGTFWSTSMNEMDPGAPVCGMMIVASYVANGGDLSRMDKSCVALMPPLSLDIPPLLVGMWLNTTDAYDGQFVGQRASTTSETAANDSSPFIVAFGVFLALFILALGAAIFFLYMWRRKAKSSAPSATDSTEIETPKNNEAYNAA